MKTRYGVATLVVACVTVGSLATFFAIRSVAVGQQLTEKKPLALPQFDAVVNWGAHEPQVLGLGEKQYTDKTKRVSFDMKHLSRAGAYAIMTPEGGVAAVPGPKNYELRWGRSDNGQRVVLRFSPSYGLTWVLKYPNWELVPEPDGAQPFHADYDVQIIPAAEKENFHAVRINRLTGTSWEMAGGKWVLIAEPK